MFDINQLLDCYSIYIPEIQRDYAQGRENAKKIRDSLLNDIFNVLVGCQPSLVLNYIYGVPNKDQKIELIDGQQRITTLFLLKWYLAAKSDNDLDFLSKLTYATRDSSEQFCAFLCKKDENNKYLIGESLKEDKRPSEILTDNIDFKKKWLNDPTVLNMLNMLDAIYDFDKKNNTVQPAEKYSKLESIKFSFISLDGFKHTEELYSAMNSRGKQLTDFELIKGDLLKIAPDLSATINGMWIPLFWEIAKKYSSNLADSELTDEEFATENHDSFLYNYYAFITQMLWWTSNDDAQNVKKEDTLPDALEMTKIYTDKDNLEKLVFAFELAELSFFECNYQFKELTRNVDEYEDPDKIVLFDGRANDEVDFFKLCCFGDNFTQAAKCYLWAYIKYSWDKSNDKANRSLRDYFILMRAVFMYGALNKAPTCVDKLSLNETQLGSVIIPFSSITDGEDGFDDWTQKTAFMLDNDNKYLILNNPLVRGCTDNITNYNSQILIENLKWLYNNRQDRILLFKKMDACSRLSIKDYDRVYLLITESILISVFSNPYWISRNDYKELINFLESNYIEIQTEKEYSKDQWEWYFIEYESFREGNYGQFCVKSDSNIDFNSIFVENKYAKKSKMRNPFVYQAFCLLKEKNAISNDLSFDVFVEDNKVDFEHDPQDGFIWKYNDNTYELNGEEDIIVEFVNRVDSK